MGKNKKKGNKACGQGVVVPIQKSNGQKEARKAARKARISRKRTKNRLRKQEQSAYPAAYGYSHEYSHMYGSGQSHSLNYNSSQVEANIQRINMICRTVNTPDDLEILLEGNTSGITSLRFGRDFNPEDRHIKSVGDKIGPQLTHLAFGNSDTGTGYCVTNAAVLEIADKCKNLAELEMSSCTNVRDEGFHAVLRKLPFLATLHCTGNDRISGNLSEKALNPLIKGEIGNALQELVLTDQIHIDFFKLDKLMEKRKGLNITVGESDGDSFAASCVRFQQGRSYGSGIFRNF